MQKSRSTVKKKSVTRLFDLSNTTIEQWQDYKIYIEKNLKKNAIFKEIQDLKRKLATTSERSNNIENQVNQNWNRLENIIIRASKKTLTRKKVPKIECFWKRNKPFTQEYNKY